MGCLATSASSGEPFLITPGESILGLGPATYRPIKYGEVS